ncbi:MAG: formylglycine-generating enzyme family protein [Sulfitobacter sp.]
MTTAAPQIATSRTYVRLAMLAGLAVVLAGAAITFRGPEKLQRPVMAEQPVILPDGTKLYVQKYEVSVAEWNVCHAAGGCTLALRAPSGKSALTTPATGLSFVDVGEYLTWLNRASGHTFRLPKLREWEFMAADVLPEEPDPIFTSPELTWASAYLTEPRTNRALRPQGSFSTSAEGIVDLDGNVWEWTQECYAGASIEEMSPDRCPAFYIAGEHIAAMSYLIRDPAQGGCAVGSPPAHLGMRLVSDRAP